MIESEDDQFKKGRFLTETQRDYLKDNYEPPSNNAEIQARYKIRQRVLGALFDVSIAANGLSDKDIEQIFNHVDPADEPNEYNFDQILYLQSFQQRLTDLLTFLTLGVEYTESLYVATPVQRELTDGYAHVFESIPDRDTKEQILQKHGEDTLTEFLDFFISPDIDFGLETILQEAVEQVAHRRNERVVSFEIETEPLEDIDELFERFRNRERLSYPQIQRLHQEAEISGSEIQQYQRDKQPD